MFYPQEKYASISYLCGQAQDSTNDNKEVFDRNAFASDVGLFVEKKGLKDTALQFPSRPVLNQSWNSCP